MTRDEMKAKLLALRGEKPSSASAMAGTIRETLQPFVGKPNTEETRQAIRDALIPPPVEPSIKSIGGTALGEPIKDGIPKGGDLSGTYPTWVIKNQYSVETLGYQPDGSYIVIHRHANVMPHAVLTTDGKPIFMFPLSDSPMSATFVKTPIGWELLGTAPG